VEQDANMPAQSAIQTIESSAKTGEGLVYMDALSIPVPDADPKTLSERVN